MSCELWVMSCEQKSFDRPDCLASPVDLDNPAGLVDGGCQDCLDILTHNP